MKNLSLFLVMYCVSTLMLFSQGYTIQDYDINVDLNTDASFNVQENITVNFTEKRRGIFRNIPRSFKHNGETVKVKLKDIKVQDHKYKVLKEGGDNVIRMGDKNTYLTGQQTYSFSYTIENALLFESDHTAFQYNIIYDWDTPIEKMTYNINLPSNIELEENDFKIFTGKTGETNTHSSIKKLGRRIYGESLTTIPANENVTIAIKLPVDYISRSKTNTSPAPTRALIRDKYWMMPFIFIGMLLSIFFRRRQTKYDYAITDQFYPPENFSPAQVGAYHDNKVNTEDLIALIPYWAHKGYLNISTGSGGDLFFTKTNPLPVNEEEYQQIIFNDLFKSNDTVLLSELKEKMYTTIARAKGKIHKTLLGKELYDKQHYNTFHSGKMIAVSFASIGLGIFLMIKYELFLTGALCLIGGIASFIIHYLKPKKSEKGVRLKQQLESLKTFLEKGDAQKTTQLLNENPTYFEELFPYAIALGVDKSWIKRMQSFEIPSPHWYGHQDPNHVTMQNDMGSFSKAFDVKEISSVFTSAPAPSPSSGGGFSGGSGGGFGGGGGSW